MNLERGPERLLINTGDALVDFDGKDFRHRDLQGVYDVLSDTPPLHASQPPLAAPPPKLPSADGP